MNSRKTKRMKSNGERERYNQLNIEFQRIARRDKKAFFKEQCLIIQENNKRGKSRDLIRKTGNIKGVFDPKMGTIKDKNCRDLVDAEEIRKRWKKYIEDLYQFRTVTQSCLTLCDPTDHSIPVFAVHHQLPEFTQTHVHPAGDVIQPSHPLSSLSLPPSIFPSSRVFPNESVLHIRWPSTGVSTSASDLPMNIQD